MMLRVGLAVCLFWLAVPGMGHAQSASFAQDLARAARLIEGLRLDEADRLLATLDAERADAPGLVLQRALLAFHRGQYAEAEELSARAVTGAATDREVQRWTTLRDLIAATHALTRDYARATSEDGRYVVTYPKGEEEILVPYALDVLEAMDRALSEVIGASVPGPIRLEIYPSADALAQVSTLTLEQIETSGTVALCKWNRLMITSPRALVRGYPWADTIAHELTHQYLSFATQEKAPVWLQEGSAKLLERRWRDKTAGFRIDPVSKTLLENATRDGKLLSFEQLHPSIAMLPSQDDAALAFAQVSTFMDGFMTSHGEAAFRKALASIAAGTDARDALAAAANTRFSALEQAWRASLPKPDGRSGPRKLARRFRANSAQAPDESQDVAAQEARRFVRLGDLLWSRRRVRAAMLEYQKAQTADADDPIVAARLARAALEAGDPARALEAVAPLLARYPDHAPTHAVHGAALFALGRSSEARVALIDAIRVNPFDPDPQCTLARVASNERERASASHACQVLRAR